MSSVNGIGMVMKCAIEAVFQTPAVEAILIYFVL